MPELPEVETVCRGLAKALPGKKLVKVDLHRPDLRQPIPPELPERLRGATLTSITRRAKYILMNFNNNLTMLLHLGMSGRMILKHGEERREPLGKHDHIVLHFNGIDVRFNDPRRFGVCGLAATDQLDQHPFLNHLGIEPLAKEFTSEWLVTALKTRKTPIKIALMDQEMLVGVGNIYASEALYRAAISPARLANKCRAAEIARLVPAIKDVLHEAIKAGGSSLRDYVQTDGELGYFQHRFAVYDRADQPCPDCTCDIARTGGIQRIVQAGRSSFYCPTRQK